MNRRSPAAGGRAPTCTLCTLSLDKHSIRVFGSVMQFLGKVGPDLFIEIGAHDCAFRSLTDSGQSFAACKFDRAFFARFEAPRPPRAGGDGGSDADDGGTSGTIRCKIAVKSFITAFKNLRAVNTVEVSVVRGAVESVLIFKLRSAMGVVKKYKFCIEECEILEAVFDTGACLNKVVCSPNKLARIFEHMHGSVEVALELTEDHVRMYTCQSTDSDTTVDELAFLQSDLTIHSGDFDQLLVKEETEFTICTRQLHAMLQVLANPANKLDAVNIFTNLGGAPILIASELVSVEGIPVLSLQLFLSTYTPDGPGSRAAAAAATAGALSSSSAGCARGRAVPITSEMGQDVDEAFERPAAGRNSGDSSSSSSSSSSSRSNSGRNSSGRSGRRAGHGDSRPHKSDRNHEPLHHGGGGGVRAQEEEEVGNSEDEDGDDDMWLDTSHPRAKMGRFRSNGGGGRGGGGVGGSDDDDDFD